MNNYFIKTSFSPNKKKKSEKIKSYWNKKRIYLSHFYQYYIYKFALELIEQNNFNSIIDVGCGAGSKLKLISKEFPNLNYIGIDQKKIIKYCRKKYDFGKFIIDDFEDPQLAYNSIKGDLIICSDVIEHLRDPNILLEYLKKLTMNEGLILISTPERDLLRGKKCIKSPNEEHIREWNKIEFKRYMKIMGFKVLFHGLFLPIKITFSFKIVYMKLFYSEIIKRILSLKPLKYNQLLLLKVD